MNHSCISKGHSGFTKHGYCSKSHRKHAPLNINKPCIYNIALTPHISIALSTVSSGAMKIFWICLTVVFIILNHHHCDASGTPTECYSTECYFVYIYNYSHFFSTFLTLSLSPFLPPYFPLSLPPSLPSSILASLCSSLPLSFPPSLPPSLPSFLIFMLNVPQ